MEGDCAANGASYDRGDDDPPRVSLSLFDSADQVVELTAADSPSYSTGGYRGQATQRVRIAEPGTYRLTVTSDATDFAIAVGGDPDVDAASMKTAGIAAAIGGLLLGGLLILLGLRASGALRLLPRTQYRPGNRRRHPCPATSRKAPCPAISRSRSTRRPQLRAGRALGTAAVVATGRSPAADGAASSRAACPAGWLGVGRSGTLSGRLDGPSPRRGVVAVGQRRRMTVTTRPKICTSPSVYTIGCSLGLAGTSVTTLPLRW